MSINWSCVSFGVERLVNLFHCFVWYSVDCAGREEVNLWRWLLVGEESNANQTKTPDKKTCAHFKVTFCLNWIRSSCFAWKKTKFCEEEGKVTKLLRANWEGRIRLFSRCVCVFVLEKRQVGCLRYVNTVDSHRKVRIMVSVQRIIMSF